MGREIEIAELLLTKFCHDMAGVIGAINNGIELMEEEDSELRRQAADLLKSSAAAALARLQFFRFIYGVTGEGKTDAGEWKKLVANFYRDSKVTLEYLGGMAGDFSGGAAKLLANMIYAASSMLPRGGKLSVDLERMQISAESEHIRLEDALQNALAGKGDELGEQKLGEREIQPYYTALLAKNMGFSIEARKTATGAEIKLTKVT